jgi:hypothetical protein
VTLRGETRGYALVSKFSPANQYLFRHSEGTLVVCRYEDEEALVVIEVKTICSVVAMVPFQYAIDGAGGYYFMIEKIGLDVIDTDNQSEDEE